MYFDDLVIVYWSETVLSLKYSIFILLPVFPSGENKDFSSHYID